MCIRGGYESNCIRDWRARKEQIVRKVKLKDPKFGYCNSSVFCYWLTDVEW